MEESGLRMKYSSATLLMGIFFPLRGMVSRDKGVSTFGRSMPRYGGSMWMKIYRSGGKVKNNRVTTTIYSEVHFLCFDRENLVFFSLKLKIKNEKILIFNISMPENHISK